METQEHVDISDTGNPLERANRALENMGYNQDGLLEIARDNLHPSLLTRIAACQKLERMGLLTPTDMETFEKLKTKYFNESAGEFGQSETPFFRDKKR